MNVAKLPKVELHLHLDCSLSYTAVSKIDPTITLETYQDEFIAPAKCTNLADFLTRAPKGFALMQNETQLRIVTQDLFDQLQADHVLYCEIRFAPLLHQQQGLTAVDVVDIVENEVKRLSQGSDIEARLLLCTLRHFNAEQSMETVRLAHKFMGSYVVGLDIAGDEAGYPLDAHQAAFHYAKMHHIPATAHAGEAVGAESVWETLRLLEPRRIGHGVRSTEDPELVDHLKSHHIHLEVCPTSNLQTDIYDTMTQHVIDQLYREGISLSINTDTRTISNTTLNKEYGRVQATFGWQAADFLQCNLNAIDASFAPESTKRKIRQSLLESASI